MNPTPITKLLDITGGRLVAGRAEGVVSRVSTDTRALHRGDLFVALRGERYDANDFLHDALNAGAAALVAKLNPRLPDSCQVPVIAVDDTLKALQKLAMATRVASKAKIIAVTGSNGKTTTKDFTAAVLAQRFRTIKTEGNLNNHIGLPLSLLRLDDEVEAAVFEMGMNHTGEIAPLCAMAKPEVGIITMIGVAHIEFLGSQEAIAAEKGVLAEMLPGDGCLVLNAQDRFSIPISRRSRAGILFAGIQSGDVFASGIRMEAGASHFKLEANGESAEASIPVPGIHMIANAVLAAAAGIALGLSVEECAAGLTSAGISKGRLQRKDVAGIAFLDDSYNANPDSMVAALRTLADSKATRRVAVLGPMGELGSHAEEGHRRVGQAVVDYGLDALICVGSGQVSWIGEEASAAGCKVYYAADPAEAASILMDQTCEDTLVLVKASRSAGLERVLVEFEKRNQEGLQELGGPRP